MDKTQERLLKVKHVFLDMDGTIYHGTQLFPTTIPFLDFLKGQGIGYTFLTNNSSKSVKAYVEKLGRLGIAATEDDYAREFLDYILAIKVVDSLDAAIEHIATYSTGHSESIVTSDYAAAEKFTACVDSAAVYVNASTRFTDGGEFGLGAEIGISTQKLHARGPMGLNELTSMKFIIKGSGQIR